MYVVDLPNILQQLSDAIGIIGREDFPDKWPNLIMEMVEKFQTGDFYVINGILHTAHSLFKRWIKKNKKIYLKSNDLIICISLCFLAITRFWTLFDFRYRHEFKSQKLWEEIKFVLENFAKPFTELFNVRPWYKVFTLLAMKIEFFLIGYWYKYFYIPLCEGHNGLGNKACLWPQRSKSHLQLHRSYLQNILQSEFPGMCVYGGY